MRLEDRLAFPQAEVGTMNIPNTIRKADLRGLLPRFSPETMEKNQTFVELLKRMAKNNEATPIQIALAWLLAQKS
jgi:aryl-alcohol dehydrogenase-like predicted oxidoreductase